MVLQSAEQPSPDSLLPSSHTSPSAAACSRPSPQPLLSTALPPLPPLAPVLEPLEPPSTMFRRARATRSAPPAPLCCRRCWPCPPWCSASRPRSNHPFRHCSASRAANTRHPNARAKHRQSRVRLPSANHKIEQHKLLQVRANRQPKLTSCYSFLARPRSRRAPPARRGQLPAQQGWPSPRTHRSGCAPDV